MSNFSQHRYSELRKPLGMVLLEADLISPDQIKVALQDQSYNSQLLLGEILALRGWLKQDTADFFAQDWQTIIQQKSRKPIGFYLRQSGLLEEKQIQAILREHQQTGIRFGTVAVLQGLLKSTTLDFFLMHLFPREIGASSLRNQYRIYHGQHSKLNRQNRNFSRVSGDSASSIISQPQIVDEIEDSIIWIG